MRKFWTWSCEHPVTAVFLAVTVLTIGMHFLLNWRAERRWNQYCEAARARGVKLTLAELTPPPITDAENFASLPMWKAVFDGSKPRPMVLGRVGELLPTLGNPLKNESMDWAAWQKHFKTAGFITETSDVPPRDILRALEHYAPYFQQWSEWRSRPLCRFPLDYQAGMSMALPHLGTFQDASKLFGLRMRAHLALGDSAAAYADFQEALQTYRILESEPTFISGLVQISALVQLSNGVGEGLKNRRWAEPELRRMEGDLAMLDPLKDRQRALASERAFSNEMFDQLVKASAIERAKTINVIGAIIPPGSPIPPGAVLMALIPDRIFRDNQLRQNQCFDELLAQVDVNGFHPSRTTPSDPENLRGAATYYYFMFRIASSMHARASYRFALTRTKLDQTRLAIALERYRLARGSFPETLAELAPELIATIPLDAASRQPMIYRRLDQEKAYLLYGIGRDQIDDGGTSINPSKSESAQKDDVWLHAPPAPSSR